MNQLSLIGFHESDQSGPTTVVTEVPWKAYGIDVGRFQDSGHHLVGAKESQVVHDRSARGKWMADHPVQVETTTPVRVAFRRPNDDSKISWSHPTNFQEFYYCVISV